MRYYKLSGKLIHPESKENDASDSSRSRELKEELKLDLTSETWYFNDSLSDKAFVTVTEAERVRCTVVAFIRDESLDPEQLFRDYLAAVPVPLESMTATAEITLQDAKHLLCAASRRNYIDDDDDVLARFNLDDLSTWQFDFSEFIQEPTAKEEQYQAASAILSEKTLRPELDRIYAGGPTVRGNPVHYMLLCDDDTIADKMTDTLLEALWNQKRISSRRLTVLGYKSLGKVSPKKLKKLWCSCSGGALAVPFRPTDENENEFAASDLETIGTLCDLIRTYQNEVLTILCLPRDCTKTKTRFLERLGNVAMVEISEDLASRKRAAAYLKEKAAADQAEPDRRLFAKLPKGELFRASQLNRIYGDWYGDKLRHTYYPQYKDFSPALTTAVKKEPEGDAVKELGEMIGLSSAKKVIDEALAYYKAQRLYAERGMKLGRTAMHMVFTGNPGTAKTTTARLFARIMRDNGLLSGGQLVEVGRSDLVGRYVGWTAPTVKKKFADAKGGVLFLDEAYSLVDDRDGLYGDEAINTIVQEMENHRDNMVVIFAGYPDKMQAFLDKNPGLRSRIAFHVPFEDYSARELCEITKLHAGRKKLELTDGAMEKLDGIYREVLSQKDFGNGRFVRNMLEKAQMAQASRLLKMDPEQVTDRDVHVIEAEDIEPPTFGTDAPKTPEKRVIGF